MHKISVASPDSVPHHDVPVVIATMPASAQQRKMAFGALAVLAAAVVVTLPLAGVQLARVESFVPSIQTVMYVADLLTATLLFVQYAVQPQRAVLVLASGFVFSGLFAFLHILAFPGTDAPAGLIGDGRNSAGWLCAFWHTTFPLAVLIYTLSKNGAEAKIQSGQSTRVTIVLTIVCVAAATAGLTWVATRFAGYLPNLYESAAIQTSFNKNIDFFLLSLNAVTIVLLFIHKRTILDHWLLVTLVAWIPPLAAGMSSHVLRFTVGWYVGRLFALVAGSALLVVLLTETMALYARLATMVRALEQSKLSLEQLNLWLDAALKNMTHGLSMFDADQRLILCNAHYNEIYGLAPEQTKPGTSLRSILDASVPLRDSGIEVDIEERKRAIRNSQSMYNEYKLRGGRIIAVNFQPMPDGGWVSIHQDITERKRAEEHQGLLIAELDHRVKNILARVAHVADYTRQGSGSMEQFVRALDARIQSMADAHSLLSRNRWRGVGLVDLVRGQLAPYSTETNVTIGGPDITLSAAQAQALAMVLQELVTNAVKYGALSHPHGRVSVSWERRPNHDVAGRLAIGWRETGGPPPETPSKPSYGTNLIRGLIPRELGGTVDLAFPPEGVRCDIEIPIRSANTNLTASEELPMAIVAPNGT
jgi:PAS domain S-box-containing protein